MKPGTFGWIPNAEFKSIAASKGFAFMIEFTSKLLGGNAEIDDVDSEDWGLMSTFALSKSVSNLHQSFEHKLKIF